MVEQLSFLEDSDIGLNLLDAGELIFLSENDFSFGRRVVEVDRAESWVIESGGRRMLEGYQGALVETLCLI